MHEGGTLHLERIYASGAMVVSVFHNYVTNSEEVKYDSIKHAIEKYKYMRDMRADTPEWVDDRLGPAILKAVRAAQRQENEGRGLVVDMGDPTEEDIERECGVIGAMIAEARNNDPELDAEMTQIEREGKKKNKKKD